MTFEKFHSSKWPKLALMLFVALIVLIHAIPAHASCGWSDPSEGDAVNLLMYGAVIGISVGFFLSGPLGWGITAGAMLAGGIGAGTGMARMILGC